MRAVLLAGLLLCCAAAQAHLLNMSRSSITIDHEGNIRAELALDLLVTAGSRENYWAWSQLAAPLEAPHIQTALASLDDAVALSADDQRVTLTLQSLQIPRLSKDEFLDPLAWPRSDVVLTGKLHRESNASALQVTYLDSFRFEEPIASTLIDSQDGHKQTRWLVTGQKSPVFILPGTSGAQSVAIQADARPPSGEQHGEAWTVFKDLSVAGFRHIFPDGVDHLLFVAALFFGSASLRGLVVIITLFTLAHSLSLGMTALGWFSAPAAVVEPLILISILWVASANLRAGSQAHARYLIVLLFGLVHGLGFASALRDIGLPSDYVLTGLAAFNLGVEAAQLAFLFGLAGIAGWVSRLVVTPRATGKVGSVLVIVCALTLIAVRFL